MVFLFEVDMVFLLNMGMVIPFETSMVISLIKDMVKVLDFSRANLSTAARSIAEGEERNSYALLYAGWAEHRYNKVKPRMAT
jgi:hypothetical protein